MTTTEAIKVNYSQMNSMRVLPCVELNQNNVAIGIKERFNWIFDEDTECGEWVNGINIKLITTEPTIHGKFAIEKAETRRNKGYQINYITCPNILEAIRKSYSAGHLNFPRTGTAIVGSVYSRNLEWGNVSTTFISRHEQFTKYAFTEWQRGWRDNESFTRPTIENGFQALQLWMLTTLFSSIDDDIDEYNDNTSRLIVKARPFFPNGRFIDGLIFRNQRLGTYARLPMNSLEFYQIYLKTNKIGKNTSGAVKNQLGLRLKEIITELNANVC